MQHRKCCRSWSGWIVGVALATGAAQALEVTPAGAFSASGELTLGKSLATVHCATTFGGTLQADGHFVVENVTFSGGFLCRRVQALGLPWQGRADSATQLTIDGMQVEVHTPLLGGRCGPVAVVAAWEPDLSAAHFRKVALAPDCRLDGRLQTTPRLQVSP